MSNKKNKFFTFMFSFIPGAGEMYFGLYKQGTFLMTLFFWIILLCSITGMGEFSFILPVIWFFGFFHVHNLKNLSEEEFSKISDEKNFVQMCEEIFPYGSDKFKKIIGYVIVLIGILLLGRNLEGILYSLIPNYIIDIIFDKVFRIAIGALVVYVGLKLIKGKKVDLNNNNDVEIK